MDDTIPTTTITEDVIPTTPVEETATESITEAIAEEGSAVEEVVPVVVI